MRKTHKAIVAFIVASILVVGILWQVSEHKPIVLFYGKDCPHCKIVEGWMKNNTIDDKLRIVRKEVSTDKKNAALIREVAADCGMSGSIGVPFLYSEGECYVGDEDVIKQLEKEAKLQ